MGRLDALFGSFEGEEKKSDLERIESIESLVDSGEFGAAISELEKIKKDENIYVGAEIIIRGLVRPDVGLDKWSILNYLKELIPIINGIESWRYRALLFFELAAAFYELGDDFSGDMALKTAINLSHAAGDDVLVEILKEIIRRGLLEKGAYAFSLVRDRKKIDFLLSQLAEFLYLSGDYERARIVLDKIESPFYRAVGLYRLALIEAERNKDTALKLLEEAIKNAERIENRHARLELLIKLNEIKAQLTGEAITLSKIIKENTSSSP